MAKKKIDKYFGHPMFYEILDELAALHSKKNRQYATPESPLGNFDRTGSMMKELLREDINPSLASALWLASKQVDGAIQILAHSKKNTPDSLEEKLLDVAVYYILATIIVREQKQ